MGTVLSKSRNTVLLLVFWVYILMGTGIGQTLGNPTTIDYHMQKGNRYVELGAYEMAVKEFQSVNQMDPKYRPAYKKLGDTYRFLKDYVSAYNTYSKFIGLSNDTTDTEGQNLLLEVAKMADTEMKDSVTALRALDGLLLYYYPECMEPADNIIKKYRPGYLEYIHNLNNQTRRGHWGQGFWQQVLLYKASLQRKQGKKKEAFETYSTYMALRRYRDKDEYKNYTGEDVFPKEWKDLYIENQKQPLPDKWNDCPEVIVLSPERSVYTWKEGDVSCYEDAFKDTHIDKYSGFPFAFEGPKEYFIQAKYGYRISKINLSLVVDRGGEEYTSYPFQGNEFYPNPQTVRPNSIPFYKGSGHQTPSTVWTFPQGIHALWFTAFGIVTRDKCREWKVAAEFIPENGQEIIPEKHPVTRGELWVNVFPSGFTTTVTLDDGRYKLAHDYNPFFILADKDTQSGTHHIKIETPPYASKELSFYWDVTTKVNLKVEMGLDWKQETTNLVLPGNLNEMNLIRDQSGIYRLIIAASPNGYSELYSSSSKDLLQWSPVERMTISSGKGDDIPRLFQDAATGQYHLIFQSARSEETNTRGNTSLWVSHSADFQSWTRPFKTLTIPLLNSKYSLNIDKDKTNQYRLMTDRIISYSSNGTGWSKPQDIHVSYQTPFVNYSAYPQLLSDNRSVILHWNDSKLYVFISTNGIDYKELSQISLTPHWIYEDFQLLELSDGSYELLIRQTSDVWHILFSKDLIHWTSPVIISPYSFHRGSRFIKTPSGAYGFLAGNVLWSASDLHVLYQNPEKVTP